MEDYFLDYDSFLNEGKDTEDWYETAACVGVVLNNEEGRLLKDFIVNQELGTNDKADGEVIEKLVNIFKEKLQDKHNWNPQGAALLLSDIEKLDVTKIFNMFSVAYGMYIFIDDVARKFLGNDITFIHGSIESYYRAEVPIAVLDKKKNTADIILTNMSVVDTLTTIENNELPAGNEKGYVEYPNGLKFIQCSHKAAEGSGAQLGKVQKFLSSRGLSSTPVKTIKQLTSIFNKKSESYNYEDYLLMNEILLWDKIKNVTKDVWKNIKSTIGNFINSVSKRFKSIINQGITKKDLQEIAKIMDYSGAIDESMVNDFNGMLLEKKNSVLKPNTKEYVKHISENHLKFVTEINSQLKKLNDISSSEEFKNSVVFSTPNSPNNFPQLKKVLGGKNADYRIIFKLVANYTTIKAIQKLIISSNKDIQIVQDILTEMIFGNTQWPLWKIYGFSKSKISYEYVGMIGSVEHTKDITPIVELLGYKIMEGKTHYTIYLYMIESVQETTKRYVKFRTGSNQETDFSMNIEGTNVVVFQKNTPLKNAMENEKDKVEEIDD